MVAGRAVGLPSQTAAGRDVNLSGTYVAGRDVVLQHVRQAATAPLALFQLPPDIGDFTDRDAETAQVCALLGDERRQSSTALTVVAIAGKPGVGKTAVAVRAAYQLRQYYPDGQLYMNLRGAEAQRLHPSEVLADLLTTLGVDRAAVPVSLDGRARLYRDRLVNRQVLVLLDNAANESQVRPLLPGSSGCAVLITSRRRLIGLAAHSLTLEVFEEAEAVRLLRAVAGSERVLGELDAARLITRSCGYLPLAVCIAGAKLMARSHWRVAKLADRLRDERRRLYELEAGDLEIRAIFGLSYDDLGEDEQRAFRLLGLLNGPDFSVRAAAALLNCDFDNAEDLLDNLTDAQVLEAHGEDIIGQTRYRFHDLLRDFSRERLREEDPATRQQALERVLNAYLEVASEARAALDAGDTHPLEGRDRRAEKTSSDMSFTEAVQREPLLWSASERANIVAAVEQAWEQKLWALTIELADCLDAFFRRAAQWNDWRRTQELALDAAKRTNDRRWEVTILRNLGSVYWEQGRWEDAVSSMEASLDGFAKLHDRHGTAVTRLELGRIYRERSRWKIAHTCLDEALSEFRELSDPASEGATLRSIGKLYFDEGRLESARASLDEALAVLGHLKNRHGLALTQRDLGLVDHAEGRLDDAARRLMQAVSDFSVLGDRRYEFVTRADLANVCRDQGRLEDALYHLEQALSAFGEVGDRRWEAIALVGVGNVYRDQGQLEKALRSLEEALGVFRELGDRRWEARALRDLGSVHAARNELGAARTAWQAGLEIFQGLGVPEAHQVAEWLHEPE